jgi:hypothetical protein
MGRVHRQEAALNAPSLSQLLGYLALDGSLSVGLLA